MKKRLFHCCAKIRNFTFYSTQVLLSPRKMYVYWKDDLRSDLLLSKQAIRNTCKINLSIQNKSNSAHTLDVLVELKI